MYNLTSDFINLRGKGFFPNENINYDAFHNTQVSENTFSVGTLRNVEVLTLLSICHLKILQFSGKFYSVNSKEMINKNPFTQNFVHIMSSTKSLKT